MRIQNRFSHSAATWSADTKRVPFSASNSKDLPRKPIARHYWTKPSLLLTYLLLILPAGVIRKSVAETPPSQVQSSVPSHTRQPALSRYTNLWEPEFIKYLTDHRGQYQDKHATLTRQGVQQAYKDWGKDRVSAGFPDSPLFDYQYNAITRLAGGPRGRISLADLQAAPDRLNELKAGYLLDSFMGILPGQNPDSAPPPYISQILAPVDLSQIRFIDKTQPEEREILLSNLRKINEDPEGRILLNEIIKGGIRFGVKDAKGSGGGYVETRNGKGEIIEANIVFRRDVIRHPLFLRLVVHEMVHAATPGKTSIDNSLLEEAVGYALGQRIMDRVLNNGRNTAGDYQDMLPWAVSSHPKDKLPWVNQVTQALLNLGFKLPASPLSASIPPHP